MTATWDWVSKLEQLRGARTPAALVTVTRCRGSCPTAPGAKMIVLKDESIFGTVGGGRLEQLCVVEAVRALRAGSPASVTYTLGATAGQCCGGVVDVFVEPLNGGPVLYLFGAGHVGQALCRVLTDTPFSIHVIDERDEWLAPLPASVQKHPDGWERFVKSATWSSETTYVAIMTHRHDEDEAIVEDVITRPARYLGLIGSDTKWARFRDRLGQKGVPSAQLDRVQCPIGFPIGGKSPAEIAISVAADLVRLHHEKNAASSLPTSAASG